MWGIKGIVLESLSVMISCFQRSMLTSAPSVVYHNSKVQSVPSIPSNSWSIPHCLYNMTLPKLPSGSASLHHAMRSSSSDERASSPNEAIPTCSPTCCFFAFHHGRRSGYSENSSTWSLRHLSTPSDRAVTHLAGCCLREKKRHPASKMKAANLLYRHHLGESIFHMQAWGPWYHRWGSSSLYCISSISSTPAEQVRGPHSTISHLPIAEIFKRC